MNIRADFPCWDNNPSFIYLDSASTAQKPRAMLTAISHFLIHDCANVGRGLYDRAEHATHLYETARATVAQFINARSHEIVFTRGTTESINMVASAWGDKQVREGDEIVISELEHHANLLPWQQLAARTGARLIYIPVDEQGALIMEQAEKLITRKTKIVAITHVSNAIGTHNDISKIISMARAAGAYVLIDAAQSAPHQRLNMDELGVDFLAFSGHKMMSPTAVGILYVNERIADQMPPYQFGGGMVYEANFHDATWLSMPHRLEAGTPAIAQAIGLKAAIDYIEQRIDFKQLAAHEAALSARLIEGLKAIPGAQVIGPVDQLKQKGSIVSFTIDGFHPHDIAAYLNKFGVCVRAGHHCAQPLAKRLGIDASVRASFYGYNSLADVDALLKALAQLT